MSTLFNGEIITFEEAESGLYRINLELDSDPSNPKLWYEKAKYFYYSYLTNPINDVNSEDFPSLYELIKPFLANSIDYGQAELIWFRDYIYVVYLTFDFAEVCKRVESLLKNHSDYFLSLLDIGLYNEGCDLLFIYIVSCSKRRDSEGISLAMPFCRIFSMDFNENSDIWLLSPREKVQKLFFNEGYVLLDRVRKYLNHYKGEDELIIEYWQEIGLLFLVVQEYYILGCDEFLIEYILKYKAQKGINLVTEIIDLWNMNGRKRGSKDSSVEGKGLLLLDMAIQIDANDYQCFIDHFDEMENSMEIHEMLGEELSVITDQDSSIMQEYIRIELPMKISELLMDDLEQTKRSFYLYLSLFRFAILYAKKFARPYLSCLIRSLASMYFNLEHSEVLVRLLIYGLWEVASHPEFNDKYALLLLVPCVNRLRMKGMYSQALRCLSYFLNKLDSFTELFFNEESYYGMIEKYIECCLSLKLFDKADAMIDLMLSGEEVPQKYREEFTNLRSTDSSREYNTFFSFKYAVKSYTIPGDSFGGDMFFSYSSLHDLYDHLYIKWMIYHLNRDRIEDREHGGTYMQHCRRILDHLVLISLNCGMVRTAFVHICEFKATDLKNQIAYQNEVKNLDPYCQFDQTWVANTFRSLSGGGSINDPKSICYSQKDLFMIQKAFTKSSASMTTLFSYSGDNIKSPDIAVLLWYTTDACVAFLYTPSTFCLETVLSFQSVNTEKIEEWNLRLHDSSIGIDTPIRKCSNGSFSAAGYRNECLKSIVTEMNLAFSSLNEYLNKRKETKTVYLLPYREMYGLPLHLIGYMDGSDGVRDCLCIRYSLSYAADSTVYSRPNSLTERTGAIGIGIVADSLHGIQIKNRKLSLPFAANECNIVSKIALENKLVVSKIQANEATLNATKTLLSNNEYVHIACHVLYNKDNPKESSILLRMQAEVEDKGITEGLTLIQRLTLQEIWDEIQMYRCRLVNLAACQSGMSNWKERSHDEFFGLVHGMLSAGVETVVASATDLNDVLSCIFNTLFYRHLFQENSTPAKAMCAMLNDLQDLTYEQAVTLINYDYDPDTLKLVHSLLGVIFEYDETKGVTGIQNALGDPIYWHNLRLVSVMYST